jgi:shikimate 5-dehydrogenase
MSSVDMITLLTQMTGRTGTLPATVTINDYADYASPPAEVVTAVNLLKATKSITTCNLGA